MYIIINKDYTVEQSKIMTGAMRSACRRGEITLLSYLKSTGLCGMNSPEWQEKGSPEWERISDYSGLGDKREEEG